MYLRVSSNGQKPDLRNQKEAVQAFCNLHFLRVDEWLQEVASGLNYKRPIFSSLFEEVESGQVKKIIVAHKDRLVRFGFE